MYFFTADQHYGHENIIKYCNRPFDSLHEMHKTMTGRHNEVVGPDDIVFHLGDFSLQKDKDFVGDNYIRRLNGKHTFLRGSHDYWLGKGDPDIEQIHIKNEEYDVSKQVILCHYCMRTWPRSHYNTYHLFGHSHGRLKPIGKSWDVGVDNNNFYPLSEVDIIKIMQSRPDNPNYVGK